MSILGLALATGAIAACGHGLVAHAFPGRARDAGARALRLGLALVLGLGAWSLAFAAAVFACGLSSAVVSAKDALLVVAGCWLVTRARRRASETSPDPVLPHEPDPWTTRILVAAVAGASVLAASLLWDRFAASPDGGWDAWAIWNMRARFLLVGEGRLFERGFDAANVHADYPFLLPGCVAQAWRWLGETPAVPALLGGVFLAASVAVPGLVVGRLRGKGEGLGLALLLLGAPEVVGLGAAQTADIALMAFVAVALGLVLLGFEEGERRRERFLLAGFAAGCAAFTKNEGALFALALAASVAVVRVETGEARRVGARRALAFGMGALAPLAVLAWWKLGFAPANDIVQGRSGALVRLADPRRALLIARAVGRELGRVDAWGASLVGLLAVAAAFARERPPAVRAASWAVGLVATGYVLVYLVTPLDLAWHLDHSLDRLLAQLLPGAALLVFAALPRAPAARPEPERSPSAP